MTYIYSLKFKEVPDYNFIGSELQKALEACSPQRDAFDWQISLASKLRQRIQGEEKSWQSPKWGCLGSVD